jgi:hypothetical protein
MLKEAEVPVALLKEAKWNVRCSVEGRTILVEMGDRSVVEDRAIQWEMCREEDGTILKEASVVW